jgi:hypothetical protein
MSREVSFDAFVEGLCTPDLLERVKEAYGMDKAAYVLHVWKDMVAGHFVAIEYEQSRASPDLRELEKLRTEMASAMDYGARSAYELDVAEWSRAWRASSWRQQARDRARG